MKYILRLVTGVLLSGVMLASLSAERVSEVEKKAQEGILYIRKLAQDRDEFKRQVYALEKIKRELEKLLAVHVDGEHGDVIEKVSSKKPEYLQPFKKRLINEIAKVQQQEVQWHVAQMFSYLELAKPDKKNIIAILF